MAVIARDCGTPACVLGHYAAEKDTPFYIKDNLLMYKDEIIYVDGFEVRSHFAINSGEACELFSEEGCGEASSPSEAADYIEDFVAAREKE